MFLSHGGRCETLWASRQTNPCDCFVRTPPVWVRGQSREAAPVSTSEVTAQFVLQTHAASFRTTALSSWTSGVMPAAAAAVLPPAACSEAHLKNGARPQAQRKDFKLNPANKSKWPPLTNTILPTENQDGDEQKPSPDRNRLVCSWRKSLLNAFRIRVFVFWLGAQKSPVCFMWLPRNRKPRASPRLFEAGPASRCQPWIISRAGL